MPEAGAARPSLRRQRFVRLDSPSVNELDIRVPVETRVADQRFDFNCDRSEGYETCLIGRDIEFEFRRTCATREISNWAGAHMGDIMKTDSLRKTVVSAGVLALTFAATSDDATATIIAGPGTGSGVTTSVPFNSSYWTVAPTESVDQDPNGNRWIKQLAHPTSECVTTCASGWTGNLSEHIQIADGPWSDWHEEILSSGWKFVAWWVWLNPESPDVTMSGTGSAGSLDLIFPYAATGSFKIGKSIQCINVDGCSGPIEIAEWPTKDGSHPAPEPGTTLLLGAGLLGLASRIGHRSIERPH